MRCVLEKAYTATNRPLRVILVRAQKEKNYKESHSLLREYLQNPEQNIGRNMDKKSHSDEITDGNEEHTRYCSHPCYKVAKDLAELCSCVL